MAALLLALGFLLKVLAFSVFDALCTSLSCARFVSPTFYRISVVHRVFDDRRK